MWREAAQAKYARLHEKAAYHDGTFPEDLRAWSEHPSSRTPFHFNHGVTIWVAGEELGLGGEFLGASEQAERDDDEPEDAESEGDEAGGV